MEANEIVLYVPTFGYRLADLDVTDPAGVVCDSPESVRQPEREFLLALLQDAIYSYQKYACSGTRRGQRLFRDVEAWLMDPDTDATISFEYVCTVLGVCPDSIRRHLNAWRSAAAVGQAATS